MQKILVLCPLEHELRPLLQSFTDLGHSIERSDELKIPVFQIPAKGILLARGGHGKIQFGIQTQYLLHHLKNVTAVLCAGAGGALAPHLKIGDLVIGEKTLEHDYKEKFDPKARMPEFSAHPVLLENFRRVETPSDFNIHFGSLAGGDEDIVDPNRANELFNQTQALAVAWEGPGGARACRFQNIPFLELRAITDNARESVPQAFTKNLNRCMSNLGKLLNRTFESL